MLKGRTDNDIKNYFYSTLRRQLRKILRDIDGDPTAEPKEITFKYLQKLLKDNNIPYDKVDNENIRNLLIHSDKNAATITPVVKHQTPPETVLKSRRESVRLTGKRYLLYEDEELESNPKKLLVGKKGANLETSHHINRTFNKKKSKAKSKENARKRGKYTKAKNLTRRNKQAEILVFPESNQPELLLIQPNWTPKIKEEMEPCEIDQNNNLKFSIRNQPELQIEAIESQCVIECLSDFNISPRSKYSHLPMEEQMLSPYFPAEYEDMSFKLPSCSYIGDIESQPNIFT